jgi:hypothetical protein
MHLIFIYFMRKFIVAYPMSPFFLRDKTTSGWDDI